MTWAGNKRIGINLIIVLVLAVVVDGILALVLPQNPTGRDGIWYQEEAVVDGGGSCAYVSIESVVAAYDSYVHAVTSNGSIDIVRLNENRNPSASVRGTR